MREGSRETSRGERKHEVDVPCYECNVAEVDGWWRRRRGSVGRRQPGLAVGGVCEVGLCVRRVSCPWEERPLRCGDVLHCCEETRISGGHG